VHRAQPTTTPGLTTVRPAGRSLKLQRLWQETIEDLLRRSGRGTVPIRKTFVQQGRGVTTRPELAARIPNARLRLCNDDGHFSLLGRHGQQVLDELLRSQLP
jgi:hypothetical protein